MQSRYLHESQHCFKDDDDNDDDVYFLRAHLKSHTLNSIRFIDVKRDDICEMYACDSLYLTSFCLEITRKFKE